MGERMRKLAGMRWCRPVEKTDVTAGEKVLALKNRKKADSAIASRAAKIQHAENVPTLP